MGRRMLSHLEGLETSMTSCGSAFLVASAGADEQRAGRDARASRATGAGRARAIVGTTARGKAALTCNAAKPAAGAVLHLQDVSVAGLVMLTGFWHSVQRVPQQISQKKMSAPQHGVVVGRDAAADARGRAGGRCGMTPPAEGAWASTMAAATLTAIVAGAHDGGEAGARAGGARDSAVAELDGTSTFRPGGGGRTLRALRRKPLLSSFRMFSLPFSVTDERGAGTSEGRVGPDVAGPGFLKASAKSSRPARAERAACGRSAGWSAMAVCADEKDERSRSPSEIQYHRERIPM